MRSCPILALAASAVAQGPAFTSDTDLFILPSWSEVGGNHNGALEPGESAEITIQVRFTNQFGVAGFSPPQGTFTSGTILGVGAGFIDLDGAGGTHGAFNFLTPPNTGPSGYGVLEGWRIIGPASNGSVNAAGTGISQIHFGQFPSSPAAVNTTNPISAMYRALWTPALYSSRIVTFTTATSSARGAVYIQLTPSTGFQAFVAQGRLHLGGVTITVVPAPPTLVLLLLAPIAARRRRQGGKPVTRPVLEIATRSGPMWTWTVPMSARVRS